MLKVIKKYGGSLIILFSKEECHIYNIAEGKIYDVELVEKEEVSQDG
jgi:hypothetical protein